MTETDPNHCHAAMSLNLFFGMMLYSIRGKVLDVMEEKETGVSHKKNWVKLTTTGKGIDYVQMFMCI